jgi:hypothetical protein
VVYEQYHSHQSLVLVDSFALRKHLLGIAATVRLRKNLNGIAENRADDFFLSQISEYINMMTGVFAHPPVSSNLTKHYTDNE